MEWSLVCFININIVEITQIRYILFVNCIKAAREFVKLHKSVFLLRPRGVPSSNRAAHTTGIYWFSNVEGTFEDFEASNRTQIFSKIYIFQKKS